MCYNYQLSVRARDLESRFAKAIPTDIEFNKKAWVSAFDYPSMPVIIKDETQIQFYEWGLIPHWAKNESIKKYTLNARVESLSEKPSFREAIAQPCLIPATGFYEWQWMDEKGKEKQKYLIQSTSSQLFSFAGLYANWIEKNTGAIRNTFTILTTQANELMAEIHNKKKRMPIILKPDDEAAWLAGANYKHFAFPYETDLQAFLI